MWLDDVVEVYDCFLDWRSSLEDEELVDDAGFFVWGGEGGGPVDIEAFSAEPARNEGALCLVT
jgi:hypothetical protein